MKKIFRPLIALTLLICSLTFSALRANAQASDQKQDLIERETYTACWDKDKKDDFKCLSLCTELTEKYPGSSYAKNCRTRLDNKKILDFTQKFQNTLNNYYDSPDIGRLEALFAVGEEFLKIQPGQQYVIGRMALAGADGAMTGVGYKSLDKVKDYAEAALKAFESVTPPDRWEAADWNSLREIVSAKMNQYLGWLLIVPSKGDQNLALDYLSKAIQVKGKEGIGWKDPYNYVLRSMVYNNQYIEAKAPYDKMPDQVKLSDEGKAVLNKVTELLDTRLIPEYARVLATSTSKETEPYAKQIKPAFDTLWYYRTGASEKAVDYIKNYTADPSIPAVPIPAKPRDTTDANGPAPTADPADVKMQPATSGAKSTSGKTKSKAKSKKPA